MSDEAAGIAPIFHPSNGQPHLNTQLLDLSVRDVSTFASAHVSPMPVVQPVALLSEARARDMVLRSERRAIEEGILEERSPLPVVRTLSAASSSPWVTVGLPRPPRINVGRASSSFSQSPGTPAPAVRALSRFVPWAGLLLVPTIALGIQQMGAWVYGAARSALFPEETKAAQQYQLQKDDKILAWLRPTGPVSATSSLPTDFPVLPVSLSVIGVLLLLSN